MDHDFLDGIDEKFERLMQEADSGQSPGRSRRRTAADSLTVRIMDHLDGLSGPQKEKVLAFIQTLKQKVDE